MEQTAKNTQPAPRRVQQAPPYRKPDLGDWAYEHRAGLCVTVIVYLLAAIVFMTVRIVLTGRQTKELVYIDLIDERMLVPEQEAEQQEPERMEDDGNEYGKASNRISNENAEGGSGRRAAGSSGSGSVFSSDIDGEISAVQGRMSANRSAWEKGLKEDQAIRDRRNATSGSEGDGDHSDTRVAGNVMVSFSLSNPVRYADDDLFIPGYQCRGGGEVVVAIVVNRNGKVTSASVRRASSSADDCMMEASVSAALRSRFNVDGSAPDRHQGTITYRFQAQ